MNTQTNTNPVDKIVEAQTEAENPMQERHIDEVTESFEVAAEAVFTARRLEIREGEGSVFVP
jgi:hypothetical protein